MPKEQEPLDVLLEVGMHESVMSFAKSPELLDDGTILADEEVIAKNGLGITRLRTVNRMVFHVEYDSQSSPKDIVRTLGFLVSDKEGFDRPLRFVRSDGTEHSIQLDSDK